MPRIVKLGGALTCGRYRHIYDLDSSVGLNSDNKHLQNLAPDVMLLQFMFQQTFSGLGIAPPGQPLAVDGKFGPLTHYWILYFQMIKRHNGKEHGSDDDGFVGPFHRFCSQQGWLAEPGKSTIFALNYQLQKRFPNFDKLHEHPAFPAMLRGKITTDSV